MKELVPVTVGLCMKWALYDRRNGSYEYIDLPVNPSKHEEKWDEFILRTEDLDEKVEKLSHGPFSVVLIV